jgi:flavin reductase (DIM6/NTAB) family NADH-FMN oxidoreductase RutF
VVVDPATLSRRDAYRWLIACLIPRPVAWVSTLSSAGIPNLAPFSFFGGVTSDPPTVMVSVGRRRGGVRKDTASNLLATGEAVIHVPDRPRAAAMVATSAEVAPDVDEFDLAGLDKQPALRVKPWCIAGVPLAFETVLERHLEIGAGPTDLFLLRVVLYHVADEALVDGLPDPSRLAAVGRLGGDLYCDTSSPFPIPRPPNSTG